MFTGLVEEIGEIVTIGPKGDGFDLSVRAKTVLDDAHLGDSIAINGVCLTVTALDGDVFTVGLAPETLARTSLSVLAPGGGVALERAALPTTRLGGHYVQGHVDGTGTIRQKRPDNDALWLTVGVDPSMMRYVVPKGYICVDGASLTVVNTGDDWFDLTLIAYSQTKLVLPYKDIGDPVNLEVDILAKYVERLVAPLTNDTSTNNKTEKGAA